MSSGSAVRRDSFYSAASTMPMRDYASVAALGAAGAKPTNHGRARCSEADNDDGCGRRF